MKEKDCGYINATGIEGNNILIFDGDRFAKAVASCAKALLEIDKELSIEYVKAMAGITVKIENCQASYDNSSHEI